ncbi:MAG: DUF1003 domain-containing protein [Acidimicrobiia bacterium]
MSRADDLFRPRSSRRVGIHYDPDAFGRFSESIARLLGTGRFLLWQTVVVVVWISFNIAFPKLRYDNYPFILLNLMFSTQAAYAAPLILLAQSRQADRDRNETDNDRATSARTQADAEYLARELASVRIALSDVVTSEDLADALGDIRSMVSEIERRLPPAPSLFHTDRTANRGERSGDDSPTNGK